MFIMSVLISITYFYFYAMVILNLLEPSYGTVHLVRKLSKST